MGCFESKYVKVSPMISPQMTPKINFEVVKLDEVYVIPLEIEIKKPVPVRHNSIKNETKK